ncbi:MAG TPA: hypothetical protein VFG60_06690 [Burkholderiaceae bacterium]|nr:hypothetical protein [Burkholderiaceae bacterium]
MRAVPTAFAIGCALWLAATSAHALGFGQGVNVTQLGQPLNFAAAVRMDANSTLARECVAAEVSVGDNRLPAGQVRVTLEHGADGAPSLRVTTRTLIDEPVVTIDASLGCHVKVARQFVLFIDPPLVKLARSSAPSGAPLPPQRVNSQIAPLMAMVQPAPRARPEPRGPRQRAAATGGTGRATASSVDGVAHRRAQSARRRSAAPAPRAKATGPRLQLDTAPTMVAKAASAVLASALAAVPAATDSAVAAAAAASPASAARPDGPAEQLTLERQRIQALEDGLARLRTDSQATQKTLVALHARLREAESQRYANPLVYALAGLVALLALVVVGLIWRQSRGRGAAQWWLGPPGAAADSAHAYGAPPRDLAAASQLPEPDTASSFVASIPLEPELDEPLTARTAVLPAPQWSGERAPEPVRELSIEELIDLEQQAEFFVVLGQDEAAIDLLMGHVRSDGGNSPLPYLKLLEIYRRRDGREAYERIRERFNRRFNAYAPEWEADLQQGRTLADYPDVAQQLQQLWPEPEPTMQALDALLFRRNKTDATFDLPAYRELLFLYSVARDLAEHGAAGPDGQVDLWLPLGEDASSAPISHPMEVTRTEFAGAHQATQPLDLDVSYAPSPTQSASHEETTPAALRRTSGYQFTDESGFLDLDTPLDKPPRRDKR